MLWSSGGNIHIDSTTASGATTTATSDLALALTVVDEPVAASVVPFDLALATLPVCERGC